MKQLLKLANRIATDPRSDRELLTSFAATRESNVLAELFRRHGEVDRVKRHHTHAARGEFLAHMFELDHRRSR